MTIDMNRTSNYNFTIIVPFYNEEENVAALEKRLSDYLPTCVKGAACVLFVNDGSTDRGGEKIKEACSRHADFFYLELEKNGGLSGALKAGIDACQSPLSGYIDADLQTDPDDFNLLLPSLDEYEMVVGIRVNRKDTFVKRISSKIANGWRRMFTHDGIADTGCPLKVFRTDLARKLPLFKGMHRFLPALAQLAGGKVLQVPVRHYPRTAGVAKYNLWNRLAGPFNDCFAFKWMTTRFTDYRISDTNIDE